MLKTIRVKIQKFKFLSDNLKKFHWICLIRYLIVLNCIDNPWFNVIVYQNRMPRFESQGKLIAFAYNFFFFFCQKTGFYSANTPNTKHLVKTTQKSVVGGTDNPKSAQNLLENDLYKINDSQAISIKDTTLQFRATKLYKSTPSQRSQSICIWKACSRFCSFR